MGLESPVRGSIHTSGSKCCEAKLRRSCGDILCYFLQIIEGLNVVDGVARSLKQGFIYDQSVGLDYICDSVYGVAFF